MSGETVRGCCNGHLAADLREPFRKLSAEAAETAPLELAAPALRARWGETKALLALGIHRPCCRMFLSLNLCAEDLQIRAGTDAYCKRMDALQKKRRRPEGQQRALLECAPFERGMGIRCAWCFKPNTLKAGEHGGFNPCSFCDYHLAYKRPVPGGVFWC
jgi:DNA-directed RNA polymerase subunit N (RpoN/RPB10)